jgi:hypothetical protein
MPSDLQITNIRDQANANSAITIASDGQITVNQNNPTLTLGSNAVFPDGMITNTTITQYKFDTNASYGNQTADEKIFTRESDTSTTVSSFTAKQGHTYIINMVYYGYVARESGSNSGRSGTVGMYYGTTSRSQGGTTLDTKLHMGIFGRSMVSATTSGTASFSGTYNMVGSFYQSGADQTIYYYGTSYQGSTDKSITMYLSAGNPGYDVVYEIKGNKLTSET